jgi:hypothetical protein
LEPARKDDEVEDEEYTLSFLVSTITLISQVALFLRLLLALLPQGIIPLHVRMNLFTSLCRIARCRWYIRVDERLRLTRCIECSPIPNFLRLPVVLVGFIV